MRDFKTASVLIVDCETCVLMTIKAMLRLKGHAVNCAGSACEALDAVVAGFKPDLIITEFVLPGMDGVTLAERIRRDFPHLAVIIASTGAVDLPDHMAQRRLNVLAKPFRGEALNAAVDAALAAAAPSHFCAG